MTAVLNGDDAHLAATNSAATSPAPLDSPTTPVSNLETDLVKIAQHNEPEQTLLLPEPVKVEAASHVPSVGTPLDPDSIPIDPPHGTPPPPLGHLLPDVQMAESSTEVGSQPDDMHEVASMKTETMGSPPPPTPVNHPLTNGHATNGDVHMHASLDSIGGGASTSSSPSMRRSADAMLEDEPPAKRARKMSDDELGAPALFANPTAPLPVAPPPAAATTPAPALAAFEDSPPLTLAQWKFCLSTVRSLKKLKDAGPFLRPVDPVLLNIPHYPQIIKHPMDLGTVERKLAASNPTKPDPNPENPRYANADQFMADVRRIFANCVTFNGPEHLVTQMGKRVEAIFDKQTKQMPSAEEPPRVETSPPAQKKSGGPPVRRPSTSVPAIRRDESNSRPKREIHAPPPRDLSYSDAPKRTRKPRAAKDDATAEQLRFCGKMLAELHKKQYINFAGPFYEPVDWVKLEIPSYPKIIKKPMDLSTMRRKLENHEYLNAQKFHDDFRLMIRNCFQFNPQGTPVNQAGMELQRLFDDKWRGLPSAGSDADDDDDVDGSDDERARQIAAMESQMEAMRQNLSALKSQAVVPPKKKEKKKAPKPIPSPVASSSKAKSRALGASTTKSNKKGKAKLAEDDVLTFEQKKALSDAIGALDGGKLEKVIQIIHEGVPEIRDSTEEIELEIDSLPGAVLTKLYNFVLKPARASNGAKRNRSAKGGGTGGINRKSMDENVEAEKIRQLEERMRMFEGGGSGETFATVPPATVVASDSDSSGSSDDSDSDSE